MKQTDRKGTNKERQREIERVKKETNREKTERPLDRESAKDIKKPSERDIHLT